MFLRFCARGNIGRAIGKGRCCGLEYSQGSRTAVGSWQTALRVGDHGLFYFAGRASETVRRYKNVSLYFCAPQRGMQRV